MSWQATWRRQAWDWSRRLDRIALGWLQLAQQGRIDSAAVKQKRSLVLKVRGWIYDVIERFLGGVSRLPNRVPLGALPHLVVGGVVVVTVASIGAWVANEEERLLDAKRRFAQAVAKASQEAEDPEIRRKLAELTGSVADDGVPWGWLLGGMALFGGLELARRRWATA